MKLREAHVVLLAFIIDGMRLNLRGRIRIKEELNELLGGRSDAVVHIETRVRDLDREELAELIRREPEASGDDVRFVVDRMASLRAKIADSSCPVASTLVAADATIEQEDPRACLGLEPFPRGISFRSPSAPRVRLEYEIRREAPASWNDPATMRRALDEQRRAVWDEIMKRPEFARDRHRSETVAILASRRDRMNG